jgi:predicted MFS family arabinose efflux permease
VSVKSILSDSKEAVKTIFLDKYLRLFIPCALLINLLAAGPLTLVLPFCMEKGFSVDMYGYLMAIWTAASLICVLVLGIVKLEPKSRFWILAAGFISSVLFYSLAYISKQFVPLCIMAFLASFANCAGNTIFNSSLMLALPEKNRGAIIGFFQSASVGGTALSAVIYGALGDMLPMYLVFTVGNLLSLAPMLYLCFHPRTKEFCLNH